MVPLQSNKTQNKSPPIALLTNRLWVHSNHLVQRVCVCAHMYVVHVVHACLCRDQRSMLGLFLYHSYYSYIIIIFFIWDRWGFSLNLELFQEDWLVSKPQDLSVSVPPKLITGAHWHARFLLYWLSEAQLRSLCLHGKNFIQWAISLAHNSPLESYVVWTCLQFLVIHGKNACQQKPECPGN